MRKGHSDRAADHGAGKRLGGAVINANKYRNANDLRDSFWKILTLVSITAAANSSLSRGVVYDDRYVSIPGFHHFILQIHIYLANTEV